MERFHEELKNEFVKENISSSRTKPLYISQVSVENDSSDHPLSSSFLQNVLENVVSNPIQNVDTALGSFIDIKRNLLFTGLYNDVDVTLGADKGGSLLNLSLKMVTDKIGIESIVPTSATIRLKPNDLVTNLQTTFTTTSNDCSVNFHKLWPNFLGIADREAIDFGAKYNLQSTSWIQKYFKGEFILPFTKVPSLRTVLSVDVSEDKVSHLQRLNCNYKAGIQKLWLKDDLNTFPVFYSGLSIVNNKPIFNGEIPIDVPSPEQTPSYQSGWLTTFSKDSTKWLGSFPNSGECLNLKNEYVLSQLDSDNKPINTNINRFEANFEKYVSILNSRVITTVLMNGGFQFPIDESTRSTFVGESWDKRNSLIKDIILNKSDMNFKCGFISSFKLPNTELDSPLRLQISALTENKFKGLANYFDGCAADTGVSLVYKTKDTNMALSYKVPLMQSSNSPATSGFSFDIAITYC
ncbi:hypothetical protein Kpol_1062p28 [Vanderwaltozyma polyspora DSM 70294]|uniref:Uncharacterized protein n=1 Tax=Vanderwaltozyma polyspora (strain ATCC 22028 / DSM 70294 / BCRC 21397 / CBS 2163 / NBRC 10782 / NRRL Y-8283 / UCD 57-17) TaxID=436907 RepID=A7TK85_VANPO|nr:uncharacterized protein Kpol_1062p28 [Vanderwaltozyma polyspora DSM 70294]EDO17320.1 hypothetical protein Kpol_1062p28 [Vanderwaltozyma polyspora DSM 70294]